MGRLLPILALIAVVLAALAAALVTGVGLIVAAVYGVVVAVFVILSRQMIPMAVAGLGALLLVLAVLGLLGGISTEDGGLDFGISPPLATAFLVAGLAAVAGGALAAHADTLEPEWLLYVGAGALGLAAILAFVGMDGLGEFGSALAMAVALLLLVAIWPIVVVLKE